MANENETEEARSVTASDPFDDADITEVVGASLDDFTSDLNEPLQDYGHGNSSKNISNDDDFVTHDGHDGKKATETAPTAEKPEGEVKKAPADPAEQAKDRRWRFAIKITTLVDKVIPMLIGKMNNKDSKNFKASKEDKYELSKVHYEWLQPYEDDLKDAYGGFIVYLMAYGIDLVSEFIEMIGRLFFKKKSSTETAPTAEKPEPKPSMKVVKPEPIPQRPPEPPRAPAPPVAPVAPPPAPAPEPVVEKPAPVKVAPKPKPMAEIKDVAKRIYNGEDADSERDLDLQDEYFDDIEAEIEKLKAEDEAKKATEETEESAPASDPKNPLIRICKHPDCNKRIKGASHFCGRSHAQGYRIMVGKGEAKDYNTFERYRDSKTGEVTIKEKN